MDYQDIIDTWRKDVTPVAAKYNLPESLVLAVIRQESSGNPNAVSPCSCYGLLQLSRYALKDYNNHHHTDIPTASLFLPEFNIECGGWYLSWLISIFKDTFKALRAYNVGIGTVQRNEMLLGSDGTKYATSVLHHKDKFDEILSKTP
jgi:soluble lytic murein transglycosylase-like protein